MKLIDGDRLAQVWPLKMTPLQWSGVRLTVAIRADAPFSDAPSLKACTVFPPHFLLFYLSLCGLFLDFLSPPLAIICPLWFDTRRHATAQAGTPAFWQAISQINNLLHNSATRGEIPAGGIMWSGFDGVDPHFPLIPFSQPLQATTLQ